MKICEKEVCTGCYGCYNICPVDAIEMQQDNYGFVHPNIDMNKCIKCDLCRKICPAITPLQGNNPLKTFAAYAKDHMIHQTSTSGGAATIFSRKAITSNGVVYGASFSEGLKLKHILIDKIEDLASIQGTKYVQSHIEYSFKDIKKQLRSKKLVVFIGAPCQVAGLLSYLMKDYENLITISFVCGGVPSQKFLIEEVSSIYSNIEEIDNIKFRMNTIYGMWLESKGKVVKYRERWKSAYFRGFDENLILRDCCYNCPYTTHQRVGDITIGDFWGLNSGKLISKEKEGITLAIATTEKGLNFINSCEYLMIFEEHEFEEAIKENPRLNNAVGKSLRVEKFRKVYKEKGFSKGVNSVVGLKYRIYIMKSFFKKSKVLLYLYRKIQDMVKK